MVELLLPPFFGALIGYFTNYVAIKMLFRPLKPYYLFGRKVPFTPGLIPSKREKLAEAIARVVKENLLTEEVIRKRLNEDRIRESLKLLVLKFLDELVLKEDEYFKEFLESLREEKLGELLDFDLVEEKLESATFKVLDRISGKSLNELLPPSLRKSFWSFVDEKIDELIWEFFDFSQSVEFKEIVFKGVRGGIEKLRAYIPLITENLADSLSERLSRQILKLAEELKRDEEFKLKASKFLWKKLQELFSAPIDLSGEGAKVEVKKFLTSALKDLKQKKLSEVVKGGEGLLFFLRELLKRKKEHISEFLADKLLKVIEMELPVILESLDFEGLVKERVNSLPTEEVEEIVLKLIREELRYITFFGGVLGFFIGVLQLLFR